VHMSIRSLLKKSHLLHFIFTLYTDKKFRRGYFHYLKLGSTKKPKRLVRKELDLVCSYWNYPPYHYYRYKLYEKELTEDQLLDYIPPFHYFNIYWEKRNKDLNQLVYQSKFFQQQLFAKHKIPALEIIAAIKGNILYNSENIPITIYELVAKHLRTEDDALFCKPEFGRGGNGIILLSKKNGLIQLNNRPVSVETIMSFFKASENYIIQERFIQSSQMAKINKSSVNTLRIYTQIKNNNAVVPACILRMGVNNSFVDNLSQGGLMNVVNVNNGALSEYAQIKLEDKKYFEHPDSKYVFKGSKIKEWQEIKSQIIKFSELLCECKDLGWDVAIGENGFKVLEINIAHGIDHPQMVFGGMRRILRVYPDSIDNNLAK
jgi:hypothetical protein